MSTYDMLFPSKSQLEKSKQLFEKVEFDPVHGVYRPTDDVVQAAWDEIIEAGSEVSDNNQR